MFDNPVYFANGPLPGSESPMRDRVVRRSGLLASVAALFLVPRLISMWAPTPFVITWVVVFALVGLLRICGRRFANHFAVQVSLIGAGMSFAALALAGWRWADLDVDAWVIAALVLAFVAVESSMAPYLQLEEWRSGIALALGVTVAVLAGHTQVEVAVALLACGVGIVASGSGNRELSRVLIDGRIAAEEATTVANRIANIDALTEVLNRRGITAVLRSYRDDPKTVLMCDVDRFKLINDNWGHLAGDQVLADIATILSERLGTDWHIGRLGGDEFIAIARGRPAVSENLIDPIISVLRPRGGNKVDLPVRISAGLTYSSGSISVDQILGEAGYALRAAKRTPGAKFQRFDGVLRSRYRRSADLASALGDPLGSDHLFAEGQVIVTTRGRVAGWEILARWRGEDGAVIEPSEFVPLLAETGQLVELGHEMLQRAIRFVAQFNDRSSVPYVAVNISASHLASPELAAVVSDLLEQHQVPSSRLMLEVTESEGLYHLDGWQESAAELRRLGIKLAIDDFGAGYSNIERISALPISHLKLDRSFTSRLDGPYVELVKGVVEFSNASDLRVVAEGVETAEQFQVLNQMGVGLMQGSLFGPPKPLDELAIEVVNGFAGATIDLSAPAETPTGR